MAIIGLMTSITIVNYAGQKQKDLEEQAVLAFVSDLRRAQNMAMAVVDCNGVQDEYGIQITGTKTYSLTCSAEKNLEASFQNNTGDYVYFLPLDETRPTIELKPGSTQSFTIGTKTINISDEGKITY